jgi:hypothetical protein
MFRRMVVAYREFMWRNHWIRQLLSVARWTPIRISLIVIGLMAMVFPLVNAGGTVRYAVAGRPATATVQPCETEYLGRGYTDVQCRGSWTYADGTTGSGEVHQLGSSDRRSPVEVAVRARGDRAVVNPFDVRFLVAGLIIGTMLVWFVLWSSPRDRTAR